MSLNWFSIPPVCVDWARLGAVRQITSLEAAAEQILHWPKSKKRDKAALLIADAYAGRAEVEKAKRAFEAAAKEARIWLPYRGPLALICPD